MKAMVKRAVKKPLRWGWRKAHPVRAKILHSYHLFLHRAIVLPIVNGMEFPDRITNLDRRLDVLTQRMELIQHELNLTVNDLVREVVRLQDQLEDIRAEARASQAESSPTSHRLAG